MTDRDLKRLGARFDRYDRRIQALEMETRSQHAAITTAAGETVTVPDLAGQAQQAADDAAQAAADAAEVQRVPGMVTGVSVAASAYLDASGLVRGVLGVAWAAVTRGQDGDLMDIAGYDVGTAVGDGPLTVVVSVDDTDADVDGLDVGAVVVVRVRARGRVTAAPGPWSAPVQVTVAGDTTPPPVPSVPLVSGAQGLVSVAWDGLPAMPRDFARVEVEREGAGVAGSVAWPGASLVLTDVTVGTTERFRARSVDRSGNTSAWSGWSAAVAPTTPQVVADIDAAVELNREDFDALSGMLAQAFGPDPSVYADQTPRVWTAQPVPPYKVGDLYMAAGGIVYTCKTARTTGAYQAGDWTTTPGPKGDTGATGPKGDTGQQGIPGTPGADGATLYTWIKYADSPTTGMSDSPTGKAYLGIAAGKTSPTESSVYGDYTWSKIVGEQGVPGAKGTDGQTTYTWIKYAPNGSPTAAQMTDAPQASTTHIGLAVNKTTATESNVPGDYTWQLVKGADGATGPKGDKGDTGAAGANGIDGAPKWLTSAPTASTPGYPNQMAYVVSGTNILSAWRCTAGTGTTSGNAWTQVNDQAVTNAATIAGNAMTAATGAQSAADGAQASANAVPKIYHSTSAASGAAPVNSTWFQHQGSLAGAVIGQWTQTSSPSGSTWASSKLADAVIANVDLGTLTVGSATLLQAVADAIWTKKITAQKVLANEVIVSNAGNMIPDAQQETGWPTRSSGTVWTIDPADGSIKVQGGKDGDDWVESFWVQVQAGTAYIGSADIKADAPGNTYCRLLWYKADGSATSPTYSDWSAGYRATTDWVTRSGTVVAPPGATQAKVRLYAWQGSASGGNEQGTTSQYTWLRNVTLRPKVDASLIVDGAVKAKSLEAVLALLTTIIAGDPNGTHAQLDPQGLRVFKADPNGGAPVEVIRLGVASSNDYLAIADTTGSVVASLDETGGASFSGLDVRDDPTIAGSPIIGDLANQPPAMTTHAATYQAGWLDRLPRGIVASAFGAPGNFSILAGQRKGICEVSFTQYPGRNYKVSIGGINLTPTQAGNVLARVSLRVASSLNLTTGAPAPNVANTAVATQVVTLVQQGTRTTTPGFFVHGTFGSSTDTTPRHVRLLVAVEVGSTSAVQVSTDAADDSLYNPVRVIVEDIGPDVPDTYVDRTDTVTGGSVTPPPAKQTYTKTYPAAWGRSFNASGAYTSYDPGSAYQGYYPGATGRMSMIGFPSVTGDVAGSEIQRVEVYLYFSHWRNNAGGTAVIGTHGATSAPATFSGSEVTQSPGWPKPGGRWVTLPASVHAGVLSGAIRGITLRAPGDSTASVYYGKATIAQSQLRVTYVK